MTIKFDRCPICHCRVDIFALAKDAATSQLLAKVAILDGQFGYALLNYLLLFSPKKSGLSADRSLRLISEIEALANGETQRMTIAMISTWEAMMKKRENGETVTQFTNHNYLKKAFEGTLPAPKNAAPVVGQFSVPSQAHQRPASATANALAELEAMKHE